MSFSKTRPSDARLEIALLTRWKCCLCEMVGNECFKHHRDYKAIITLFNKWFELTKNSKDEIDKEFNEESKKFIDYTPEELQDDWSKIEDIRILVHSYLRKREPSYDAPEIDMPETWATKRIRELTQS